jgi:branched-chain amino acid transport system substrate-binding protein
MKATLRHSFSVAAAALTATAVLSSCSRGGGGGGIKVGEFASLTGKEATFGMSSHEGTQLAIDELNAAGGVLGKKIELLTEDNQTRAGESANIVNKLISRDGVVAVLGEVASSRSLEAAPICQSAKIPMITPASTNPTVTEKGDFIFRVCFTDIFQGASLANFATQSLKAQKVAVLTDAKSDYSKGLAKYFKTQFAKNGGQIGTELDYNGGDKDFKSQLTTIRGSGAQAVFIPGYYGDVALICIQARELGITVPLFGGDGWESSDLLTIGKEAAEGYYFSTHSAPDQGTPKMVHFVEAYKKKYGGKVPDAMAALGYDSAYVLADALKRAGTTDGSKLRDALAGTKDFEGATGKFSLDPSRNAHKSAVILQIKNGKFAYHATVSP